MHHTIPFRVRDEVRWRDGVKDFDRRPLHAVRYRGFPVKPLEWPYPVVGYWEHENNVKVYPVP